VAAQLGYCGLDRARGPLRGDEIRGCWEAALPVPDEPDAMPNRPMPTSLAAPEVVPDRTPVRRLEFIEVGTGRPIGEGRGARSRLDASRGEPPTGVTAAIAGQGPSAAVRSPGSSGASSAGEASRWSLWSDAEV
jgi:hypothetical protein